VVENVIIRPELPDDHSAIEEVVRGAFAGHPDEVALLVERIRASPNYVPSLALVATDASGVIGHVMLSFVPIEGGSRPALLVLTPMSVRPDRQRRGVGARLIRDLLGRAEAAREPAVLVEGIPAYYPRFGFERASPLGFVAPHASIPDDAFMIKKLSGYEPSLAGGVVYPTAFDHLVY
jgi:putative acetyltransferase